MEVACSLSLGTAKDTKTDADRRKWLLLIFTNRLFRIQLRLPPESVPDAPVLRPANRPAAWRLTTQWRREQRRSPGGNAQRHAFEQRAFPVAIKRPPGCTKLAARPSSMQRPARHQQRTKCAAKPNRRASLQRRIVRRWPREGNSDFQRFSRPRDGVAGESFEPCGHLVGLVNGRWRLKPAGIGRRHSVSAARAHAPLLPPRPNLMSRSVPS